MTAEETVQVNTYIQNLNAQHTKEVFELKKQLAIELKYRKMAQADSLKMGTALVHIWNYSVENPTMPPVQFMVCVRQMLNYYAQDFEVPF